MALWQRQPEAVIHHSGQGCQYTSIAFGLRCRKAGVRPSMGSIGDCYDNALCESFFATLECDAWIAETTAHRPKPGCPYFNTSRAGTTPIDDTQHSDISLQ